MNRIKDQTLAMAGMLQAINQVDLIAHRGEFNSTAFNCCLQSLFVFDADSSDDIYQDKSTLSTGIHSLVAFFGSEETSISKNTYYYLFSLLKISKVLLRDKAMTEQIFQGLQQIEARRAEFQMEPSSMVPKIDELYQNSISKLSPRIIVRGEQAYLRNSGNAARIRVLLLASIRAAVLWQQSGGTKWGLLLHRKRYIACARGLL
ncbi:MAG: high frequency lysogenization protein [Gammaproteobacteria bacterium]|jgi:high frequency lysogenization protein